MVMGKIIIRNTFWTFILNMLMWKVWFCNLYSSYLKSNQKSNFKSLQLKISFLTLYANGYCNFKIKFVECVLRDKFYNND